MFLIHNYILLRSYQYQVNLSDNETLVRVMIDDMESLDGLSDSSDDGIEQSQVKSRWCMTIVTDNYT